jgi:hypothetical protein
VARQGRRACSELLAGDALRRSIYTPNTTTTTNPKSWVTPNANAATEPMMAQTKGATTTALKTWDGH